MLGYCEKTLGLEPLEQKFAAFGWQVHNVDGHAVEEVYTCLKLDSQVFCNSLKILRHLFTKRVSVFPLNVGTEGREISITL